MVAIFIAQGRSKSNTKSSFALAREWGRPGCGGRKAPSCQFPVNPPMAWLPFSTSSSQSWNLASSYLFNATSALLRPSSNCSQTAPRAVFLLKGPLLLWPSTLLTGRAFSNALLGGPWFYCSPRTPTSTSRSHVSGDGTVPGHCCPDVPQATQTQHNPRSVSIPSLSGSLPAGPCHPAPSPVHGAVS